MSAPTSHVLRVVTTFYLVILQFSLTFLNVSAQNEILELNAKSFEELSQKNKYILLLLYEDDCANCHHSVSEMVKISVPTLPDLKIGKSKDKTLSNKFFFTQFPALVYSRNGHSILYDGEVTADELSVWLEAAQEVSTQTLNDETFEHLTQAATGATTGDWFVLFYKPSCDTVLTVVDTVAFRMKQRMNVAKVDVETSSSLKTRFDIDQCPTGLLFRHGKMYRFPPGKFEVNTLKSFLESWFKNVQAEPVKPEPSPFDNLIENIVHNMKVHLEGPHRTLILAGFGGGVMALLLLLFCCCRQAPSTRQKED